MGQSGNPAKRSYQQQQKELEAVVRNAAEQGTGDIMIRPFSDIEVYIRTRNPDHAWAVAEAIQPINDNNTDASTQLGGIIQAFWWYTMVAEENPKWFKEMEKALKTMNEEWERMAKRYPATQAAMKAAGIKSEVRLTSMSKSND